MPLSADGGTMEWHAQLRTDGSASECHVPPEPGFRGSTRGHYCGALMGWRDSWNAAPKPVPAPGRRLRRENSRPMFDRRNTSRPASRAQRAAFGGLLAALALLTDVSVAEHSAEFTSGDEVHSYIQTYYRSPQPGRITAFIRSLGTVYPMTSPSANQAVA